MGRLQHRLRQGALLVACGSALTGVAACGSDDLATQQRIRDERADAARAARQDYRIKQLEREARRKDKAAGSPSTKSPAPAAAPSTSSASAGSACGGGLSVGPNTSCAFAQEVRDAYQSSGGSSSVVAYSPVTHQDYVMSCTSTSPHTCTGGNNASVYFP